MKVTSAAIVLLASFAPAYGFTSYLDQMTGGKVAAMKPASFAPSSGKPKASSGGVGPGGYLDNIAGGSPAAAATPPPPPPPAPAAFAPAAPAASSPSASAPAVGDYLSSLTVSSTPAGSGLPGYLDTLRVASEAGSGSVPPTYLSTLKVESAGAGSGFTGYLDAIGGGGTAVKSSSYAPTKSSKGAAPSASAPASSGGNNAVLDAIGQLNSNMRKNQMSTIDVLKEISKGVKVLVDKAEAKASAAASASAPQMTGAPAGTPWQ
jgi:hypothetical protein